MILASGRGIVPMYNSGVKNVYAVSSFVLLAAAGSLFAQTVQKLDPAIDRLAPPKSVANRVATDFNKWNEGPVRARSNFLLFAEIPGNIMIWRPGGVASVFLHPSGYKGSAPFGGPEPASNGMTLDARGRLTVVGHARRNVGRLAKLDPSATVTVLADTYEGKQLNSPNDLVHKSDGSLYFTDPPYGLPTQSDQDPAKQLKVNGVYRIVGAGDQKPGAPPDRAKLQASHSGSAETEWDCVFTRREIPLRRQLQAEKLWMRYSVQPDGCLANGKVLYDAPWKGRPGDRTA